MNEYCSQSRFSSHKSEGVPQNNNALRFESTHCMLECTPDVNGTHKPEIAVTLSNTTEIVNAIDQISCREIRGHMCENSMPMNTHCSRRSEKGMQDYENEMSYAENNMHLCEE